jgi:ubiquinone biosynthesis protein COQ4
MLQSEGGSAIGQRMEMTNSYQRMRFRPWVALDAIRQLIRNKEDTTQVFRILQSLRGWSQERMFKRFKNSAVGARVLANKENLVDVLCDRDYLLSLPHGSLGRAFIAFMDNCGITPQGLTEAARASGMDDESLPEDARRFGMRIRVQHDLWHVVDGYGCDGLGEVCNVAFSYPQTGHIGFMVIGIAGGWNYAKAYPDEPIMAAMWEGYRRGKKAAWLPAVDWAALLPKQLADVRADLGLSQAPGKYLAAPRATKESMTVSPIAPQALAA